MPVTSVITPEAFIAQLPVERQAPVQQLRQTFLDHLPTGFEETAAPGFLHYVVPHTRYPAGYHCNPAQPLPFISIASQKNFIAVYHMGLYAMPHLLQWFRATYPAHSKTKLDMGKSCIRFKKPEAIPVALLGELAQKVSVAEWIAVYEKAFKR